MKVRNILMSVALCAASINCFAANPEGVHTFTYQGKLERLDASSSGSTKTIFDQSMGAGDGHPGVFAHQDKEAVFEQIKEGNKTITRSVPLVYGYRFVVLPETLAPGQFETTGRVTTSISVDQSVKGKDGKPVEHSETKNVSLTKGETATLDWVNAGEKYRLTVKLNDGKWNKFE